MKFCPHVQSAFIGNTYTACMERSIRYTMLRNNDRVAVINWIQWQKRQIAEEAARSKPVRPDKRHNPLAEEEAVEMNETHAD
jgi:hypothetical protein